MTEPLTRRVPGGLCASALALLAAAGGPGCGRDTVTSGKAVQAFNRVAEARGVALRCPERVDSSTETIDCTLEGTRTGKTAPVKMRGLGGEDDFIDAVDGTAFNNAVQQVTQP